jgi:hypothetical protein
VDAQRGRIEHGEKEGATVGVALRSEQESGT